MNAAPDQNAYLVGKAKIEKALVNFELAKVTQTVTPEKKSATEEFIPYHESTGLQDYICFYNQEDNCVEFYLNQDIGKLKQIVVEQQKLLARYAAMKASRQYIEVSVPMTQFGFGGFSAHVVAVELDRMQSVLDIAASNEKAGIQRLVDNALHNRKMLKNSATHASRAMTLTQVQRDVRILSELMTKYPALAKQYKQQFQPLLASISTNEYSLLAPFINERNDSVVMFATLINSQKLAEKTAKLSFYEKLKGVQFQVNSTLNFLYDWKSLRFKIAQADAQHLEAVKAQVEVEKKALLGFGFKPYYFNNTIGKVLVTTLDAGALPEDFEAFTTLKAIFA